MANLNILLIESDPKERMALTQALETWSYRVTTAPNGKDALTQVSQNRFELIIADGNLPEMSVFDLLQNLQAHDDAVKVVCLTPTAAVDQAVQLMKAGAADVLAKPLDRDKLRLTVQHIVTPEESLRSCTPAAAQATAPTIVTQDPSMQQLIKLAQQVADSRASVLIQGESGTGKELFARLIHQVSQRKAKPFVAINCGALPETLLESELFGHEKGAFTGAVSRKPGKFELADGGTILLDEITEMQLHLQAKLLRVLQEREVDRVGGSHPLKVDVRVVATTNRDVGRAIEKNEFRSDLFYRLNVVPIKIPPLRQRAGDIPLLADHFIEKYNALDGRDVKKMTNDAVTKLVGLSFPGNVRELENIMERAVLLCDGEAINARDLFIEEAVGNTPPNGELPADLMSAPLKEVEKKLIFHTLDRTNGNRTHAAKMLGISVRTLRNKLNEYKEKMG